MSELALCLIGDSAFTPPSHILENLAEELAHARVAGAPHTIYGEVWHAAYWQQMTLEWVGGVETPCPAHNDMSFPDDAAVRAETWAELCARFLRGADEAAALADDETRIVQMVRCPSPPGKPLRTMSVREQLESLAAHSGYHLGRVVLLRQMLGSWPPPSGGFTW
jgi:uncharacterized damage-inducible protein DinB